MRYAAWYAADFLLSRLLWELAFTVIGRPFVMD
jgi:hypothetical protein